MPELPEVNTFQRYFDQHALRRPISKVKVSDDKIIRNVSGRRFATLLKDRQFVGSYRRGKYLFGELDNGHHVLLHFGMTGDLVAYAKGDSVPKHERFHLDFGNGERLGFDCPRKFARILYLQDLQDYLTETGLGEDAQRISLKDFLAACNGKTGSIKGLLLNQKCLAGMGNLYADAVCYDTRIHPASRVNAMSKSQLTKMHKRMQTMLSEAIALMAKYDERPEMWFWDWRVEGNKPKKGHGLVKVCKVAGRTTYYCEGWQKEYK